MMLEVLNSNFLDWEDTLTQSWSDLYIVRMFAEVVVRGYDNFVHGKMYESNSWDSNICKVRSFGEGRVQVPMEASW